MALKIVTPPTAEPITLAEAKAHLRVDHDAEDTLIAMLLQAAREDCEKWTARAFMEQTWRLTIDGFPTDEIMIPLPPLISVTSVKYDDGDGFEQTLATSSYTVDDQSEPGWIVPGLNGWEITTFEGINAVRVEFVAGYASSGNSPDNPADNVPAPIKAAILLTLGHLYEHREDVVVGTTSGKLPAGAEHLLRQYRVALGMA